MTDPRPVVPSKLVAVGLGVLVLALVVVAVVRRDTDSQVSEALDAADVAEEAEAAEKRRPRYRVRVREATLDELLDDLEKQTEVVRITVPTASHRAGVNRVLLREGQWEGEISEILEKLAQELKLCLELQDGMRARLTHTSAFVSRRKRGRIRVRETWWYRSAAKAESVCKGWRYRVVAAPRGDGVAIVLGDRIDVYAGNEPRGSTGRLDTPPRGVTWSPDGRRLAYAFERTAGEGREACLGVFFPAEQGSDLIAGLPPLRPDSRIAWLEKSDALAVTTTTGVVTVSLVGKNRVAPLALPPGGSRLDIHGAGGDDILVARDDALERFTVTGSAATRRFRTSTLGMGYQVQVRAGSTHALIRTPTLFTLCSLADGRTGWQGSRMSAGGLAEVAQSGRLTAWRSRAGLATYIDQTGATRSRVVLKSDRVPVHPTGLRWFASNGDGLLHWTDEAVTAVWLADDGVTLTPRKQWGPVKVSGTVKDVQWAGAGPLITVEIKRRRKPFVEIKRLD